MVILAFVLLILVGAVSFVNPELMTINLYFLTLTVPMWAVFIAFLLIGMLIAALFGTSKGARNRQVIKNKNKEIERAEEEKEEAVNRAQLEKDQAIERLKLEKEEAVNRAQLEKEEAIEQVRKESDLQIELQNREAEIQKLKSRIAQEDMENTTRESTPIQTREQDPYMDEKELDPFMAEEEFTGYEIDPTEEDKIEN